MRLKLQPGDVVRRDDNGGWWWMAERLSEHTLQGRCIQVPTTYSLYKIWSTSAFAVPTKDPRIIPVPPDEVPEALWGLIAERVLLGEDNNDD